MPGWVADSAARPGGAALKAAGCVGVVRYAGALASSFNITADEVADYHAHGLPVGIVCEQRIDAIMGGHLTGNTLALAALNNTRAVGIPDGLTYIAGDSDLTLGGPTTPGSPGDRQMGKVADTLSGAAGVLGWEHVGFYGGYWAIQWLIDHAVPVAAFWQASAPSWSWDAHRNFLTHPRAALVQYVAPPQVIPRDVDYNSVHGDWHPRTAPAPPPPPSGGRVPTVTGVHMDRLHPAFLDQLHQLANVTGHDIYCQSTGRTDAEQEYLYNGWIHHLPGFNPANPPGGPSWHRFVAPVPPSVWGIHAQAADISTVGLGGASARSVFGPYAAQVGLEFAIPSESWHIQPAGWVKHPEVPFPSNPAGRFLYHPTIQLGSNDGHPGPGKPVTDCQNALNILYGHESKTDRARLVPDGDFGSATDAEVRDLQTKCFHAADGIVGPKTWLLLGFLLTANHR